MAWAVKYRHSFYDLLGVKWTTDIYKDAWAGGITTLTGSGNPVTFDFYGDDDIFEKNILGSKMTLEIWAYAHFAYSELFTADDFEFKVIVSHGITEYWTGYIQANNYQEPYDHLPVKVSLIAIDSLGLLKNFKFIDLGYTTRQKISVQIYAILSLIKITTFTEYVNLYEDSMAAGVGDSPLDQLGIDPDLFAESNCYEALEEILKMCNAGIRQDLNIITIYRFKEVKNVTMYGRIFTSGTAKSAITKTPLQYINRIAQASDFHDHEGGVVMITPQAKQLIVNYDLGLKQSCLRNWEFKFDDFILTEGVYSIPNWDVINAIIKPISLYIPGEDHGIYAAAAAGHYIEQGIANVKTRSPSFKLSFTSRILNNYQADITYWLYYKLTMIGATTKYWNGTAWVLADTGMFTKITKASDTLGWSDWEANDLVISSVPHDGTLWIRLYMMGVATELLNVAYKDVKLVMTPLEGSEETGIAYTVNVASTGEIMEKDLKLGDGFTLARQTVNQRLNYHGILNAYDGATIIDPGNTWFTRGNTENVAILDLISSELGAQYARQKQKIDLPVRERAAGSYLSLIGNIQDVTNVYGANPRIFAISQGSYKPRTREWELTIGELL